METIRTFDAMDRCDRCNSQAYHAVTSPDSGKELLFCAHHLNRHHDNLLDKGWSITTDVTGLERLGARVQVNI
jgi:hypothetical protein